jgi:rhamnose utilization protein RhaD (predicted bifunctional aldolase and dehydrogenase)
MIDQSFVTRIDKAIARMLNKGYDPVELLEKRKAYLEGHAQRLEVTEYVIASIGSKLPDLNIDCKTDDLISKKQSKFDLHQHVETFKREVYK